MIWNRLGIQKKTALISTFIFGILAHGMMIFNKFSNHDDLIYIFQGGVTFTSGRWMLYIAEKIRKIFFQDNLYSIPSFNGFFVFLCIAISSCILIDLFNIRSRFFSILISGIMVCTPVITSTLGHMFTAQFFSLSILLAVTGSYLILKKDRWFLIISGIILLTCSVGIYQAYIPTFLCILLFGLIKFISEAKTPDKVKCLKKIIIVFFSCISVLILYITTTYISLRLTKLQLSNYKGINSAYTISLAVYIQRAVFAYKEFFLLTKNAVYNIFPGTAYTIYIVMVFLFMIMLILQTISSFKQNKLSGLLMLLFSLLSPLCINFIFIMTDVSSAYAMTSYAYTIFIVFFIYLTEKFIETNKSILSQIYKPISHFILGLLLVIFIRYDNACYTRMEFTHQQTLRYYSSLITRMQSTPGYRLDMRVAYIGENRWVPWDPTVSQESEFDFITTYPFWGLRGNIGNYQKSFMKLWFDFSPREAEPSLFEKLPEVKAMPSYPDDGSIKVINDTLVVKFW